MKFLSLYLLRALGISIGLGVLLSHAYILVPIPGRRISDDRIALSLVAASFFLILQLVTMPYLVYRRQGKDTPLTVEDIHNEQLRFFKEAQAFGRRHRTMLLGGFIGLLVVLVLVDSFTK